MRRRRRRRRRRNRRKTIINNTKQYFQEGKYTDDTTTNTNNTRINKKPKSIDINDINNRRIDNENEQGGMKTTNSILIEQQEVVVSPSGRVKMTLDRQILYINRWMNRHPVAKGWLVRPVDHWAHTFYKKALNKSLSEVYHVKKSIKHGILKADLYEKIK